LYRNALSPWKEFNPQLKQTRIFIDHFFNGFSYEDLAVMFDESVQEISNTYNHAIERLLRLLEYLDRKKQVHHYDTYIKKGEEQSKAFPKRIKVFLLYTVFGLMIPEICQLENIKHYTQAWQMIRTVGDQLRSNEISLLGVTPEEREAGKKRKEAI
jgi:hypothetical protein